MKEFLCDPTHLFLIIGILLLSVVLMGTGKGLGALIGPIIKKWGKGTEINLNMGKTDDDMGRKPKGECVQCGLIVDPTKCPLHANEHERSLRNETGIRELVGDLKGTRKELFGKLDGIEVVLTEIKIAVAKLVVERNYQIDQRDEKRRAGGT
jgi:hypothetical protein